MKKITLILFLIIFPQILFSDTKTECNVDNLYRHVKFLTSIMPPRNHLNIKSLDRAADYIKKEFESYRYRTRVQEFTVDGKIYKNIIASYGNSNSPRIIIGAHYDVFGVQPGADDNASGTAGLLELSRLVALNGPKLKYRIDFVAYSLEEPPYFRTENMGSAVHAKSLSDEKTVVKLAIVLEMIGYFTDAEKSQAYPSPFMKLIYPDKGDFITVVGRFNDIKYNRMMTKAVRTGSSIKAESLTSPSFVEGVDFSDHMNYWLYGYNAVMITDTAFYRNPNYHKRTDTIDTLDFKRMAEVVKGIYYSLLVIK
ncbi:MAG: M28 family peptidase [Spirochaetes bacterium]|jgi:Zn-dependent M28 family amino/carboxypeptidase|nr:M28 family peptidase [Spirochaetota bacterium]